MSKKTVKKKSKKKSKQINKNEIDYVSLLIFIAFLFAIFGGYSLLVKHSSEGLQYPNNSGIHPIYIQDERIGHLSINAKIISNIDVIAANTPTRIVANISYTPSKVIHNETLHFWLWYMGVEPVKWIIPVEEIFIDPGSYVIIDKEITFPSEGVYRHALRSYNGNKISPEYQYGTNFSVYGKDTAIALEHSYLQRESNDRIIGLSCIVIMIGLINITILIKKKK